MFVCLGLNLLLNLFICILFVYTCKCVYLASQMYTYFTSFVFTLSFSICCCIFVGVGWGVSFFFWLHYFDNVTVL